MKKSEVRSEVEDFRVRTAYGDKNDDCFPPWYLHQMYKISETEAIVQSAEGSTEGAGTHGYDFGIDAFHLDGSEPKLRLVLIQAKYSDSLNYIIKGFRDLESSIEQLQMLLRSVGSDVRIENKVIVNLRAALNRLDPPAREALDLEFIVIHLFDGDHEILGAKAREAKDRLKELVEDSFPERTCVIKDMGPREMGTQQVITVPSAWTPLALTDVPLQVSLGQEATMYYAVGHLAELVDLYSARRDALFSKNVRYFINKKENTEKGAAGKMRKTLEQVCNPKYQNSPGASLRPEVFALYHNGVTIFARDVEPDERCVKIREPYVLNGCQTIKNAFLYLNNPRNKNKIDTEKWRRILVPLRILHTKNDDLIRAVTINNNRQNAISYAALRANDPSQIRLEERFRNAKIFYERQEGAYASLEDTSPELIEDEYANTRGKQVNIVELARSIAAAEGEISFALHPSDLFESDTAYNRVFSEKRLASITLLTFLQNLHDVLPVILKKDLGFVQNGRGPRPGSLGYYAMCLLVRYLAKKRKHDFVYEFGCVLWGRHKAFRSEIRKLLAGQHSDIKAALKNRFLSLEDSKSESLNEAFDRTQAALRLGNNIDVFDIFKNLDTESKDE